MCHREGTDVQPSPLEGNIFPICLASDVATAKGARSGQAFPHCQSWPVMALQCTLFPQADAMQGITFTSCLGSSEGYGTRSHECPMQGWISESWPKVVVGLQASFAAPTACHSHCFRSGGKVPLSPLPSSSHTWGHPSPPCGVHVHLLITH